MSANINVIKKDKNYVLTDIGLFDKERFYNYSRTRTYMESLTWESWDTTYLICHMVVVVITMFYGR